MAQPATTPTPTGSSYTRSALPLSSSSLAAASPSPFLFSPKGPGRLARKLERMRVERLEESRRVASAKYRDEHREKVLEAGRVRAARRRAALKDDEVAKAKAREASARYRAQHREELALKQRKVRKRAFIQKHGLTAHIQRRFDAPMPSRDDRMDEYDYEAEDYRNLDMFAVGPWEAPRICDM
ncbi:hypothetical protein B0H15DRAFT_946854 [Mycena belliarum]|uniref:Uncharacterized protein n=1 Tax=Mycena belliarum TaxID=1033014 RepID=A0AAD6U9H9_9AGAR|nr:hypothetical protein B0H15DRAFT_946854 [Mycena belliae]